MIEDGFTWSDGLHTGRLADLTPFRGSGIEKAVLKALSKAGGDAIRAVKVASSRSVRFRRNLKVARVNESLPLAFPRSKTIEGLQWTMRVSGAPVPVVEYPHRQTRKGVSVSIKTGRRVLIKSAFVATMRSGHVGVFKRTGKGRLPIKELFTTKVSDVFGDAGMIPAVLERGQVVFGNTFDRVFPLELSKISR